MKNTQKQFVHWIRAKGLMDGATNLLEAAAMLEKYACELDGMWVYGITLDQPIDAGNGVARTTDEDVAIKFKLTEEPDFGNN